MGYYINPQTGTKEEWLAEHGLEVESPTWPPPEGTMLVCLIENPTFTAAGIVYSEQEFQSFAAPDATPEEIVASRKRSEAAGLTVFSLDTGDQRPRTWYLVAEEKVMGYIQLSKWAELGLNKHD